MSERCSTCGRVVDLAGTHACWSAPAPSLRAEIAENEPTPERFLEMAEHIVEAIAHHHKYRELDVEILGETSRRLRLMAAAPSLRAELAEAKAEIARLNGALAGRDVEQHALRNAITQLSAQSGIVEAATALVTHRRGLNHWNGTIENDLINKLIDAVTAVEEGQKP